MPMPPPKATTVKRTGARRREQVRQIVRALRAEGELSRDELARLVGAPYWKPGHFDRALQTAIAEGLVETTEDGRLAVSIDA
jgi:predicted transcriptional regulator